MDLTEFAEGRSSTHFRWGGDFRGRSELILELSPAIRRKLALASSETCDSHTKHLRKWWRFLDQCEASQVSSQDPNDGTLVQRVQSVGDLGPLHGSKAVQAGMSKNEFSSFLSIAEVTRRALGLRPLAWTPPDTPDASASVLAPSDHIRALYHAIKRDWHAAVDHWRLVDCLLAGASDGGCSPGASEVCAHLRRQVAEGQPGAESPVVQHLAQRTEYEESLLKNALHWLKTSRRIGSVEVSVADLCDGKNRKWFDREGLSLATMTAALFPGPDDIRAAFHLCMTVGGLNPSVLTSLEVDLTDLSTPPPHLLGPSADQEQQKAWVLDRCSFLSPSPIKGEYAIVGWKERSKAFIDRTYQWKQHLTPGPILVELILRSWPLRMQLIAKLETARERLANAIQSASEVSAIDELRAEVHSLESGSRSVWIYLSYNHGVFWLHDKNFNTSGPTIYLDKVADRVNMDRVRHGLTPMIRIKSTDFRDAYAVWALDYSGGDVLAVMIALDHRRLSTTNRYLNNHVVLRRVQRQHRLFQSALFTSLEEGELDPTVLAMRARSEDLQAAEELRMKARLVEYRKAVKSRYLVGCRDPKNPNKRVDPTFEADGTKTCRRHRCTLCHENAIITADSYPGLMLRQAELELDQENMPLKAFMNSDLDAELENTRSALSPLLKSDPLKVMQTIESYKGEIRSGRRRHAAGESGSGSF